MSALRIFFLGMFLVSALAVAGCQGLWGSSRISESQVDSELSTPEPAVPLNVFSDKEPQQGFAQEPPKAQVL